MLPNSSDAFVQAMQEHPDDAILRMVFADWLEEQGDPRGEVLRLLHTLTQSIEVPNRDRLEDRLRGLVAAGVQPVGPFFTNSIGMKFAWIPAGTFLMGSLDEDTERGDDDETQHPVTLSWGFYLSIYPVTQAAWRQVMGNNPSAHQGDDLPVEQVSWDDCQEFLRQLSGREGRAPEEVRAYHLPTEAEWEYACRAGTTTTYHFGDACNGTQANCDGEAPYATAEQGPALEKTCPVCSYPPNAFGLYDMHGNVWEWCADWAADYSEEAATDPCGPEEGYHRIVRGGSYGTEPRACRAGGRNSQIQPSARYDFIGFRVAFYPT